jgi:hypothetical protein
MKAVFLAAAVVLLLSPAQAGAQQMKLELKDGRVTLDAHNVPVRQILAEWARLGGAKIVNGEKVAGAPVTLQLTGVPERQALDIVLRSVSGYMLASREIGTPGLSAFDRILILPTSVAPRGGAPAPPAAAAPFGARSGMRPMPGAQPVMPVETDVDPEEEPETDVPESDAPEPDVDPSEAEVPANMPPQRPPARQFRGANREMFQLPQPFQAQPFNNGVPPQAGEEQQTGQPGVAPSPGNPFGLPAGTSATPGVVTPVPPPQQQPGQRRPPPQ